MEEAAELTTSNKGAKILIDSNKYQYRKRKTVAQKSYWSCREAKSKLCMAKALTEIRNGQEFILKETGEHNHSNDLLKKRVQVLENKFVDNAAINPTIATRTILGNISNRLQNESLHAAAAMSTINNLKMKIYRARRKEQVDF